VRKSWTANHIDRYRKYNIFSSGLGINEQVNPKVGANITDKLYVRDVVWYIDGVADAKPEPR
jgi:hypothetical protein